MLVTVRDNYESPVIKFEPVFNLKEPKSHTDYNYSPSPIEGDCHPFV